MFDETQNDQQPQDAAEPPISEEETVSTEAEMTDVPQETLPQGFIPDPFAEEPQDDAEPITADAPARELLCDYPAEDAEAVQKPKSNVGGIILLILMFLMVLAFSMLCIMLDIQKGSPSGGYRAGDIVQVNLLRSERKDIPEELRDENGRYTIVGIGKVVMPSIVEIYTYTENGVAASSGSGIILTEDGYIATNAHVVANSKTYEVTLNDGTKHSAELIGHDTKTDLAVLKINQKGLQPAILGDSDKTMLGEDVCALGNPAGFTASISAGIISGLNRSIQVDQTTFAMECFQTDAAISPGNSGGALVNRYGEVIGITSSKYGSSSLFDRGYEGLGFAITINEALPILTELLEQGYVSGRVRIGIQFYDVDNIPENEDLTVPEELKGKGILVMAVDEDSDLAQTTFKAGDWILEMNGHAVKDYDTVLSAISGLGAGDRVHAHCATVNAEGKVEYYEIDFTLMEDTSGDY